MVFRSGSQFDVLGLSGSRSRPARRSSWAGVGAGAVSTTWRT